MLQKSRERFLGANADFLGLLSSSICAVHCMAMPLLASVGLTSVGEHHNHFFDFFFLALGILFAGFSLVKDYFSHRHARPIIIGLIGFTVLTIGITSHVPVVSVIGGIIIAISHIINFRYKKSCRLA